MNSTPLPKGHPEAEARKLTLQTLIIHSIQDYKTRLTLSAALKRSVTDLDMGLDVMYETSGPDNNGMVKVKYAREKEVSVSIFWSHPRTTLEHIEGRLNITIPTFKPMVIEGKLHENKTSVYIVSLHINYFSVSKRKLHLKTFGISEHEVDSRDSTIWIASRTESVISYDIALRDCILNDPVH